MSLKRHALHAALLVGLFSAGCANRELAQFKAQLDRAGCNQLRPIGTGIPEIPAALTLAQVPGGTLDRFSANNLHIAHAIGVLPMLADYVRQVDVPKEERTLEQRVQLLELRRKIAYRCDLASLEISSVASELDCEEEKISQLANRLKGMEATAETRLNVAAIAVGAMGAVVTGIQFSKSESDVDGIGIGFGIAGASLGVLMLLNGKKTSYMHPRNALRTIRDGSDPEGLFPPSVWYCLVTPVPGMRATETLRQELLGRWSESGPVKQRKELAEDALLFGNGGTYSTSLLEKRSAMYDQLESTIKLVKQDLLQLVQELDAQTRD